MTETTAPSVEVFSAVAIEREIAATLSKARTLTLAEIERRRDRFGVVPAAQHAAAIMHACVAGGRGARMAQAPILAARADEARTWLHDHGRAIAEEIGAGSHVTALIMALTGADG